MQLDDRALSFVELRESRKGFVYLKELDTVIGDSAHAIGKRHPGETGPAFGAEARLGVVDEDSPHEAGRDSTEMGSIFPGNIHIDQPLERFVHDRGGLQGMPATLRSHVLASEPPKLVIDERGEPLERLLIPCAPLNEQLRNGFLLGHFVPMLGKVGGKIAPTFYVLHPLVLLSHDCP